ncbi:MAG TPA: FAD-binding oxidoreductase [Stellaceae bacterium]|nr:FAD-binding oxidoreductase [Stellaceae bacterium]
MPRRVAVVGAGILGMACARFLQRDGHAVTVIDPREPGDGASFGNAGVIANCDVAPLSMPGVLRRVPGMLLDPSGPLVLRWRYLPKIAPWLLAFLEASRRSEEIAAALAPLLAGARPAYDALLREAGAADLIRDTGWLKLFSTERALRQMDEQCRLMRRHGIRFEALDAPGIRRLEPGLAPIFTRALFFPDCAQVVNPKRLVAALAGAFAADGGEIARERATGFDLGGGRRAVVTEASRHPADAVVLAAGAWSRPLAALLGARVPLDTERGYHAMFPSAEPGLARPALWWDEAINLVPMEHGLRLTSGVEFAGLEAPPDYRRIDRLARRARAMLPSLAPEPQSRWLGFRPSLPDSLPVLGPSAHHEGVYFAFGHQHLGLTLGAISGRIVADLVAGRDPGIALAPYRAERWNGG